MAHFRGTVQGNRSEASRLGHKSTGISTSCNGWASGVTVSAHYHEAREEDYFAVYATNGSGYGNSQGLVGRVAEGYFFLNDMKFRGKQQTYEPCPRCRETKRIRDDINGLCRKCFNEILKP